VWHAAVVLIDASKEVGLEAHTQKIKYMLMSPECRTKSDIQRVNISFGNVAEFKYMGMTVTNQNLIHGEIKSKFNLVNAATIQFRTFCLLTCCLSNIQVKMYETIILPVVLYGCETLSVTLRKEHRQKVFENMVLKKIFEPKRGKIIGRWRKSHIEELHNLYTSPNIIRMIK
jgi:hypothetical protein